MRFNWKFCIVVFVLLLRKQCVALLSRWYHSTCMLFRRPLSERFFLFALSNLCCYCYLV